MSLENELNIRADGKCELCGNVNDLHPYQVSTKTSEAIEDHILACEICSDQIENPESVNPNHWRCLNDSMWNEQSAVQVVAWRMLTRLKSEGWPQDLLDMLYLDDDTLAWAKETGEGEEDVSIKHIDSNGVVLAAGDTVVLIKDLNVKGANFTAKRGTSVRNISLAWDNAAHIEGKVSGQSIVILTKFVKKS